MPRRLESLSLGATIAVLTIAVDLGAQAQFALPLERPATFLPSVNLPAHHIAVGNFVPGGRPEVVVVDDQGFTYHAELSSGVRQGGFIGSLFSPGAGPRRIVVADINSDGVDDVASFARDFTGPALPTFRVRRASSYSTLTTAMDLTPCSGGDIGDVDGNGQPDVVLARAAGLRGVTLLRNINGTQLLEDLTAFPAATPAGGWPRFGDFDGDGDQDVFVLMPAGQSMLFMNNVGRFVDVSASLPQMNAPQRADVGDFDGDGIDDVVCLRASDVCVLWGGVAGMTLQSGVVPGVFDEVAAGDFDADGSHDIVAFVTRGFEVFRSAGNRQFASYTSAAFGESILGFGAGDVDGDGSHDIIISTDRLDAQHRCFYGGLPGVEDASATGAIGVPSSPRMPLAADMDGDGRMDVLVPDDVGYLLRRSTSFGQFRWRRAVTRSLAMPVGTEALARDLDGDGDVDLLLDDGTQLSICLNDGTGTLGPEVAIATVSGAASPDKLQLADIDGDGAMDAVRIESGGYRTVHDVSGTAQNVLHPWRTLLLQLPRRFRFADLDGDSDPDIVADGLSSFGRPLILENDGTGVFVDGAFRLPANSSIVDCVPEDLDGDGDLDLIIAIRALVGGIQFWINQGNGLFVDGTAGRLSGVTSGFLSPPLLRADLDLDGDLDLICGSTLSSNLVVLIDPGTGQLTERQGRWDASATVNTLMGVAAADMDGDGDLDFLSSSIAGQGLVVNYTRQLVSTQAPRVGGLLSVELFSGPGYSPAGTGIVLASLAAARRPQAVLGIDGLLELALTQPTAVLSINFLSTIGRSSVFAQLPNNPAIVGVELYMQALVLPDGGTPGLTNALREVVLP